MALMFEWHWQHPARSLVLKEATKGIKHQGKGPSGKLLLLNALMRDKLWSQCELEVNFLEIGSRDFFLKLQEKDPVSPAMKVALVGPTDIDDMAKAPASFITASNQASEGNAILSCCVCKEEASKSLEKYLWCCRQCGASQHVLCAAEAALRSMSKEEKSCVFLPKAYTCHACQCVWSRNQAAHMTFSPQYLLGGSFLTASSQGARVRGASTEALDVEGVDGDDDDEGMSVAESEAGPWDIGPLEDDPWAQVDAVDGLLGSGTQTWPNPREEVYADAESSREGFVYDLTQF